VKSAQIPFRAPLVPLFKKKTKTPMGVIWGPDLKEPNAAQHALQVSNQAGARRARAPARHRILTVGHAAGGVAAANIKWGAIYAKKVDLIETCVNVEIELMDIVSVLTQMHLQVLVRFQRPPDRRGNNRESFIHTENPFAIEWNEIEYCLGIYLFLLSLNT
jgi:hypothetical protein